MLAEQLRSGSPIGPPDPGTQPCRSLRLRPKGLEPRSPSSAPPHAALYPQIPVSRPTAVREMSWTCLGGQLRDSREVPRWESRAARASHLTYLPISLAMQKIAPSPCAVSPPPLSAKYPRNCPRRNVPADVVDRGQVDRYPLKLCSRGHPGWQKYHVFKYCWSLYEPHCSSDATQTISGTEEPWEDSGMYRCRRRPPSLGCDGQLRSGGSWKREQKTLRGLQGRLYEPIGYRR